jgi:hypothetical protein
MTAADVLRASDSDDALEVLHALGCTDGLPVVIPTPERVERMVVATGEPGDLELGAMGPNLGACTVENLAIAMVMAGCLPDYAPVVVAAALAVMDPEFDLTEMQATTHCTAPLILVNGPVRGWCSIESGYGALGPGFRANASIGRALRLAMINIGGGRAGVGDMALLGHPGKFTFCLAEAEEKSPFEPLHVARGFDAEDSVVTVVGSEPPHSVIGFTDADDPTSADRLLNSFAAAIATPTNNNATLRGGQVTVVMNPDHANLLAAFGHTRATIAEAIKERAVLSGAELARTAGLVGAIAPDARVECIAEPDDVLVLTAGGNGLYSAVMPSWAVGPHKNRAVSKKVALNEACDVPAR